METLKKPSILFLIFATCFAFWFSDLLKSYNSSKNETNFVWDGMGYYSYLPSTFYYNGSFEFEVYNVNFLGKTKAGARLPKYTYGVALLEAPFFCTAMFISSFTGNSKNGFSSLFADIVRFGNIVYVFIGLLFLRKLLLNFFNEPVVTITLFCCLFGSMVYMYTFIQSEISHGYLFALFCIFLYLTFKWHQTPNRFYSIWLAFTITLISITRFTEIYIALVFFLWEVKRPRDFKTKFKFFIKNAKCFVWVPIFAVILWLPQMAVWKHYLGSFCLNPYGGERFFWKDPQILNILFSYRKGWVTYTPIVLLSFVGVLFIKRDFPLSKITFAFIIASTVYAFSCWWDWNYGGCFGARAFCQLMALLAIPIASLLNYVMYENIHKKIRDVFTASVFVFIFSCAFLNISQSYQYAVQGFLHPFNMSKDLYWPMFRMGHYSPEFLRTYSKKLHFRDETKWVDGFERNDNAYK